MESPVRLLIVDDQVSYRDALAMAIGITDDLEVVGVAGQAAAARELCVQVRPDLIVTDYRLPDGASGTGLATEIRELGIDVPILVLTGFLAPQVSRETAELTGVHAVSKDEPMESLLEAIRIAAAGEDPTSGAPAEGPSGLSDAELEVLELLNNGRAPADIAEDLFLSLHTIRARIKSIHRKLGVSSQVEAIAAATRLGLLVPPT